MSKYVAAVPCDVFAVVLDPKSKLRFREMNPNKNMSGKDMPKEFDSGIQIQSDLILKRIKMNLKADSQTKPVDDT